MVIACPSCGGVYRMRREVDGSGTRVSCPSCQIEFVMLPSQLEATGERSVLATLPDPGLSVTPAGERVAAPAEVPLDDEPSDAEVLSATAVGEPSSRVRTDPPAPMRIRRAALGLASAPRPLEHPSLDPDAELGRLRDHQGVDPVVLARRLLDEERMVPQERFVQVRGPAALLRWMFVGVVFVMLIMTCGTIGAVAGGSMGRARPVPSQLGRVMTTSAAVAPPRVEVEVEEEAREEVVQEPKVEPAAPSPAPEPPERILDLLPSR